MWEDTASLPAPMPSSFTPHSWYDGSTEDHLSLRASYQLQDQHKLHGENGKCQSCPTQPFLIQSPWLSLDQLPCWLLKRERRKGNHRGGWGSKRWTLQDPSSQQVDGLLYKEKRSDPQRELLGNAQTRFLQLHQLHHLWAWSMKTAFVYTWVRAQGRKKGKAWIMDNR